MCTLRSPRRGRRGKREANRCTRAWYNFRLVRSLRATLCTLKALIPERHPVRLAWHYGKALCAALLYGFPARKLQVIAITGTDGKTTTVAMVTHILRSVGKNVGATSTAFLDAPRMRQENATHLTSLSPFVLQRFLRRLVREGCTHAVVEVSSHGLVQGRVHHLFPCIAAVTNVTPEHLDYHGSFEQYRRDKGKIFRMLRGPSDRLFGRTGKGIKVLNGADASTGEYQTIPSRETIIYNLEGGDLWLSDRAVNALGSRALLHTDLGGRVQLTLNVPGAFNLENALCAIACAMAAGIPLALCLKALETFRAVPGRLEEIAEGQPYRVFVDFAVTVAAYEKTLSALRMMLREGSQGRLLALCSACGNRMREKRPAVGHITSELADVVVATSDETYGEDPESVLEEVWVGIQHEKVEAHKIVDRREAIRFLLRKAQPGDIVVFCGMGPFTTMQTLEGEIPWDERKIVREELRKLGYRA